VAGRGSVFSDERVRTLAASFVPAADEVWRLQRGDDADCRFFQRAVNGGELITDGGSRQGIWVFAPSGKLLANVNSLSPDTVGDMLERGLAAFAELPQEELQPADVAELTHAHRWEDNYPTDGLVLERIARDVDLDPDALRGRWNPDYAWFSAAEMRGFLPAEPEVGAEHAVPRALVERLARYHLVDNVRGQTVPFAPEEVREAELVAHVTAVEGDLVDVQLEGLTRARADGRWLLGDNNWKPHGEFPHTMKTHLLGQARFDLAAGRFVVFELIAIGRRYGRTEFNARGGDAGPSLVGFHFGLSDGHPCIAPTFVDIYDADWIVRPASDATLVRDR
jgi:hypothetical protein